MHSDYLTQCLRLSSNILVLEGNGKPLQPSCLENPMDRGAWQATVHGVVRVGHNLANKPMSVSSHILLLDKGKRKLYRLYILY